MISHQYGQCFCQQVLPMYVSLKELTNLNATAYNAATSVREKKVFCLLHQNETVGNGLVSETYHIMISLQCFCQQMLPLYTSLKETK
jgi:hypothetical protein